MKKAKKRKTTAKKAAKPAKRKPSTVKASGERTPINRQPQDKQQAATASGMFLYTNDAWSLQYFNTNDLHFKEREVFG